MIDLDGIRDSLHDRNLSEVSRKTGLSYDTVWRVARGATKDVSYKTVVILSDYLEGKKNGKQ